MSLREKHTEIHYQFKVFSDSELVDGANDMVDASSIFDAECNRIQCLIDKGEVDSCTVKIVDGFDDVLLEETLKTRKKAVA